MTKDPNKIYYSNNEFDHDVELLSNMIPQRQLQVSTQVPPVR